MEVKVEINKNVFNDVYYPLLESKERYIVLYGGGGSGKSVFAAQRYIYKLLTGKCNLLAVRAVANTLRDSVFAELKKVIKSWKLETIFKILDGDMRIRCANGNEVLFRGLDDVEKLKSVTFASGDLTDIWIEEASEIVEEDFNQLDIRLRGVGSIKQMVLTFNPIDVNHWLKKRFFDVNKPSTAILHTTYKDNRFIDDDYKALLESYRETDPYYYDVYCRGLWGVYGKTIFNAQSVNDQIAKNIKPVAIGCFLYETDVAGKIATQSWVDDVNGDISIYALPQTRVPYVIGGDTAGDGSDFATAQVLDNITGQQVASLRTQMDEDLYTYQIACLGHYYNDALVGLEANFSTYPIRKLQEIGYTNQYMREVEDTITHKLQKSFGFRTTATTRPIILANLIAIARENIGLIVDQDTLFEMLTFVRNAKGRMEAKAGAHDDLIMALAIAHYVFAQGDHELTAPKPEKGLIETMFPKFKGAGQSASSEYMSW